MLPTVERGVLAPGLEAGHCQNIPIYSPLYSVRVLSGSFEGSATSILPQSRVQNLMPIMNHRSAKTVSLVLQHPSLALRMLRLFDEIHINRLYCLC